VGVWRFQIELFPQVPTHKGFFCLPVPGPPPLLPNFSFTIVDPFVAQVGQVQPHQVRSGRVISLLGVSGVLSCGRACSSFWGFFHTVNPRFFPVRCSFGFLHPFSFSFGCLYYILARQTFRCLKTQTPPFPFLLPSDNFFHPARDPCYFFFAINTFAFLCPTTAP